MENYENKELLKDAAKKSLESLKDLKPGTEEYNTAANMALKLYDMQLKDEAQENEKQLKEDEAVRKVHELELDQEKAEKARKLDWAKIGIHDLKTGAVPAHMEQLFIYDALFCMEYHVKPKDILIENRIYQNDDVLIETPTADIIDPIIEKIKEFDKIIADLR